MSLPFRLQLIVDWPRPLASIEPLLRAGVDCVQIRIREATARELVEYVTGLMPLAAVHGTVVLVNGRLDVALAAGAAGVQLPAQGIPLAMAKQLLPDGAIGKSVHSREDAEAAERAGADFVTFGHVFASGSHPHEAPQGLENLEAVVRAVKCPVVAIGGIAPGNVERVLAVGAQAVAVIGSVWQADEPAMAVRQLKERLERCTSR